MPTWSSIVRGVLALTLPLLAASAAFAQEPTEEPTVETVADPGTSADDPRTPSGFVTRLKVDDSFEEGRGLDDLLLRVPGVNVRRSSGPGQPAFASIRGGNARQMAVTLDGMRLSAPFGAGFDVGTLSLAGIDEVEVHRGGAAVFRGSGALTGSLDLKTRLRRTGGWTARATTLAGSHDTYGARARAEVGSGDTALRLTGGWRQSQGDYAFLDRQGDRHVRRNNDHRRLGLLAGVAHRVGDHTVRSTIAYQNGERGTPGPSEFQQRFSAAHIDEARTVAALRGEHRGVVERDSFVVDGFEYVGVQWRQFDYVNEQPLIGMEPIANRADYLGFAAGAGLLAYQRFGNVTHLDLDVRRETYEARQTGAFPDDIDATRTTLAAGLADELLLFGDALSLLGAFRAESVDRASDNDVGLLPSAGVIWRPLQWLHLKGNLARTFRAPGFDELYTDTEILRGNSDLEPERATAFDAGVVFRSGMVEAEAVYFENHIDSLILFLPVSSYLVEAQNLTDATSRGVESALGVRPHRRFALRGGYTFTLAQLDAEPGTQLPHQPRHRAHGRAEMELAGLDALRVPDIPSLRLFSEVAWRSRVNLDNFGNLTSPAWADVSAGAAVSPFGWMELTVTARNLLDRQNVVDALQQPLPGRSFYAALTLSAAGEDGR